MKWNDLTMKERSDLMSLFLKHGIGYLSDMKHIYDGEEDIYYGGDLKGAKVSASLTRDQWNDLYRQGKVSLSEVPKKYQSWIEGENSDFKKGITDAISRVGTKIAPVILGGAAGPVGMISGLGNTVVDATINALTGGRKDSWGDLLLDREKHPIGSALLEFTNPANFIGGGSSVLKRLRGEHYYDVIENIRKVFGKDSKEYQSALKAIPKLKYNIFGRKGSVEAYNPSTNEVVYTPISSKSSIAHELGHSVGKSLETKGMGKLYASDYKYAGRGIEDDNIDIVENVAREQYADAFRQLVSPYKGWNKDIRSRVKIMEDYLNRNQPHFNAWSKSGEEVPLYLQKEYADIYRRNRLDGLDVLVESKKLGISPQAYLQMQSANYKKFLEYWGGTPNIEYHGSMHKDAYEFPSPSSKKYKGKTPGTATGTEGIYTSPDKKYAEGYTKPYGAEAFKSRPIWYKGGKNYKVTVGIKPIDQFDPRMGDLPFNYMQRLDTPTRKYIESLGYNGIRGESVFEKYPETVLFYPSQIKSLEGNMGYFSPYSDNIFKKYGGKLKKK